MCQQLIAAALRTTGASTVTLRVYRDNPAAVALYAGLGFAEVPAESSEDVIFMRKPADQPDKPVSPSTQH